MSGPVRDLFHAWRGLRKKPGFLVASLLTLAIGIGANVTIFSLVNGLSLRPMPFGERTDRLVTIHPTNRFELSEPVAILLATWIPASRAARVEPTTALRDE